MSTFGGITAWLRTPAMPTESIGTIVSAGLAARATSAARTRGMNAQIAFTACLLLV